MELDEIPQWMEKYIGHITEGQHTSKKSMLIGIGEETGGMLGVVRHGVINCVNIQICLLKRLHADGLIK